MQPSWSPLSAIRIVGHWLEGIDGLEAFTVHGVRRFVTRPSPAERAGAALCLLLVGCFMDMYSAIVVVVPIIVPLGIAYGIDPIHLGIIFLANLELGLLTPTAGINIFLSSYRFGKPVLQVSRAVIPVQCLLFVGLLLITYLPALTTFLPRWLGR